MRIILYLVLFLLFFSSYVSAQISTVIDDFRDSIPSFENSYLVRHVNGRLEFMNLPEPLKQTTIQFTLEVKFEFRRGDFYPIYPIDDEWEIEIIADSKNTRLVSDSVLTWPGSHIVGDVFTGEINFIPIKSGYNELKIGIKKTNQIIYFKIGWCLDENGILSFLGNPEGKTIKCSAIPTFYFNDETMLNGELSIENIKSNIFDYDLLIKPIFKFTDTTIIDIKLKSRRNLSEGFDLNILSINYDIIDSPDENLYKISKGDEFDIRLEVSPHMVREEHILRLEFSFRNNKNGLIENQFINIYSIFDGDGKLKYIDQQSIIRTGKIMNKTETGFTIETRDILSKELPHADKTNNRIEIKLLKNSKAKYVKRIK